MRAIFRIYGLLGISRMDYYKNTLHYEYSVKKTKTMYFIYFSIPCFSDSTFKDLIYSTYWDDFFSSFTKANLDRGIWQDRYFLVNTIIIIVIILFKRNVTAKLCNW